MQEFSYLIDTNNLENLPDEWTLEPSQSECEAIQKRLHLKGLSNFKARITLKKDVNAKIFHLWMDVTATVVQECVVTLDPIAEQLKECFQLILQPGPLEDQDFEHLPEIIELPKGGVVDMGELMIQNLSLMLTPFPKKPEIESSLFEATFGEIESGSAQKNPFDALKNLDKQTPDKSESI